MSLDSLGTPEMLPRAYVKRLEIDFSPDFVEFFDDAGDGNTLWRLHRFGVCSYNVETPLWLFPARSRAALLGEYFIIFARVDDVTLDVTSPDPGAEVFVDTDDGKLVIRLHTAEGSGAIHTLDLPAMPDSYFDKVYSGVPDTL